MLIEARADRSVLVDGRILNPERSQKLRNHSPDGFNWGYEGSGPAQLALAILLAAGIPPARALLHYQAFKREYIRIQPQETPWTLALDVPAWVDARIAEQSRAES